MRNIISFLNTKYNNLLIVTFLLYFFKNLFWPLTYLFIPSYSILLISFLFLSYSKFGVFEFVRSFWPAVVLVFIFILLFVIDGNFQNYELLRSIVRLSLLFSLFYVAFNRSFAGKLNISIVHIIRNVVIMSIILSIFNILKIMFQSFIPESLLLNLNLTNDYNIAGDRNFFALYLILSFVAINYHYIGEGFERIFTKSRNAVFNLLLILNILLSSSRRGIFIFTVLLMIFIVFIFYKYPFRMILRKLKVYLFIISSLGVGLIFTYKFMPKSLVLNNIHSYATLLGCDDKDYIYRILFEGKPVYEPVDSILIDNSFFQNDSYWKYDEKRIDFRNVETEFGKGVQLISLNNYNRALQYNGPEIFYYANHTYLIKFKIKFLKGDLNSFHLGWDVNDGGRGTNRIKNQKKSYKELGEGWYECNCKYTFIDNHHRSKGFIYNLKNDTEIIIADFSLVDLDYTDDLPKYVYEKRTKKDLNSWLDNTNPPIFGHSNLIINGNFEYGTKYWGYSADSVEHEIVKLDSVRCLRVTRGNGNKAYWSLLYLGRIETLYKGDLYELSFKYKVTKPPIRPFFIGFWKNEGNGYLNNLKPEIKLLGNNWKLVKVKVRFNETGNTNMGFPINSQYRNSEFYITDIKLKNLSKEQKIQKTVERYENSKGKTFYSPRTERWYYAKELWDTKYKWYHKVFGHGFDYLEWYGQRFYPNTKKNDWPHNPFITVLLYSGLIGLVLYIFFMIKVVLLYLKHRKKHGILFVGFIITFFFAFFSAGDPFDPPVMGFFIMLPFFIDYIHKKDNSC